MPSLVLTNTTLPGRSGPSMLSETLMPLARRTGRSELNLVTCGGAYDASRGGYQSNVVVYTRLV